MSLQITVWEALDPQVSIEFFFRPGTPGQVALDNATPVPGITLYAETWPEALRIVEDAVRHLRRTQPAYRHIVSEAWLQDSNQYVLEPNNGLDEYWFQIVIENSSGQLVRTQAICICYRFA